MQARARQTIFKALAQVTSLLSDAYNSAQSAFTSSSSKGLSDNKTMMQLATTQRDLALLNDATPSVAFQYAASAYNAAASGVYFAAKIDDGDSLRQFAYKMKKLYRCYRARS